MIKKQFNFYEAIESSTQLQIFSGNILKPGEIVSNNWKFFAGIHLLEKEMSGCYINKEGFYWMNQII